MKKQQKTDNPIQKNLNLGSKPFIQVPKTVQKDGSSIGGKSHKNDIPPASLPLNNVICSFGKLNKIELIDRSCGIKNGPVFLTILQNWESEAVIGFYVSYHQPCAITLLCSLRHALSRKRDFHRIYPNIQNDWPRPRMIDTLVVKDRLNFRSSYLDNALLETGTTVRYSSVISSRTAESMIDDLNYFISCKAKRRKSSPPKASYTPADLDHMLNKYFVDGFNAGFLLKLDASPIQAYESAIEQISLPFHPPQDQIDMALCITEYRHLTPKGIRYQGLHYKCPDLYFEYLQNLDTIAVFKVMPWDLSRIFVETDKGLLEVPAEMSAYTLGLSLDQHRATLRAMRRKWFNNKNRYSDRATKLDPKPA